LYAILTYTKFIILGIKFNLFECLFHNVLVAIYCDIDKKFNHIADENLLSLLVFGIT